MLVAYDGSSRSYGSYRADFLAQVDDDPSSIRSEQDPSCGPEADAQALAGRMMPYASPVVIDGRVRLCAECGAERDWLVINQGQHVWMRCRCGHQWHEPVLSHIWYDQHQVEGEGIVFDSLEDGISSLGFDGSLRGLYWN
ncbi:hypothetical protein [Streptomyces sp. 8N616]|uniref:hypothetical protein n=1 Tax=Streptomyces sp. 8N616 TaxID=3457414 RepID=UPI003FCFCBCF